MLLLRTRLLPLLAAAARLPSHIHHHACLLSTSAAPFSLEDYLVAACGLAPAEARETAKKAFDELSRLSKKAFEEISRSRLNSASNPDAIIALLSAVGLARTDIAAIVAADPLLLRSSPKKIGPRLLDLRDHVGLSTPQIVRFLLVASRALRGCDVGPNVKFFISFFGSFDRFLVIVKNNNSLIWSNLERVGKNLALLRQCGQSVRDIDQLCSSTLWVLTFRPERVKEILVRAEELGVHRSSPIFKEAVAAVARTNKEKVATKLKFLKSTLGCSESEVAIAISKKPNLLMYSEKNLECKIQFLLNEVGIEPQYIVERPALLGYSLNMRLVPRHCVMKVLLAKGLLSSDRSFYRIVQIREEDFKLSFIDCHKDSVPGLADVYASARAGIVPSKV